MFLSWGFHVLVHVPPATGNKLGQSMDVEPAQWFSEEKHRPEFDPQNQPKKLVLWPPHTFYDTEALLSHVSTHNKETIEKNTDVALGWTAASPVVLSEVGAPQWPIPSGGPRQTLL